MKSKKLSNGLKIMSWNINGIRAVIKKNFLDFLKDEKPDILCLQEIKIDDTARNKENFDFPNYEEFWNSAERKGYSGTMMLIKNSVQKEIISQKNGFKNKKFDQEGRVQTIELPDFYLINAYFPNAGHGLKRLDYKLDFDQAMLKYCQRLNKKKPIILTGDYNVAHQKIDLANPESNHDHAGFTPQERKWMSKFLNNNFVDTFRKFYPQRIKYTYWSYRTHARDRNVGWRLDYFCVSQKFTSQIKDSLILDKVIGSDHCPIGLKIK